MWQGSFEVDFRSLKWKGLPDRDGSEKIDLLVPMPSKFLGPAALLKVSSAYVTYTWF